MVVLMYCLSARYIIGLMMLCFDVLPKCKVQYTSNGCFDVLPKCKVHYRLNDDVF
jgi:hypothetical protein